MIATSTGATMASAPPRRRPAAGWALPATGALVGALVAWLMHDALYDDALITLTFARNLVSEGCWCITPGLTVHTATSPLNVWLLAGLILLVGHPMWAVALLTAAGFLLCAIWLRQLAGPRAALLGVALLATAPVVTQAVGMESLLGVVCLLAVARYGSEGRWWAVGVAVAAAPLVRPDLALGALVVVGILAVGRREVWRPLGALAGGALLTLPWWAWSWWALGSVWPDTMPVKAGMGDALDPVSVARGFVVVWPVETGLTVAALLLGGLCSMVAARRGEWAPGALAAGGLADLGAMAATATNPATYYAAIATGTCLLAVALAAPRGRVASAAGLALLAVGAVWLVLSVPSMLAGYHPWRQNGATNPQYAAIAAGLPRDRVVLSENEIGALAYHCLDAGCRVVDPFLADPGRVAERVDRWRADHSWAAWNYRNHSSPAPVPAGARLVTTRPPTPFPPGWPATGADLRPGVISIVR